MIYYLVGFFVLIFALAAMAGYMVVFLFKEKSNLRELEKDLDRLEAKANAIVMRAAGSKE